MPLPPVTLASQADLAVFLGPVVGDPTYHYAGQIWFNTLTRQWRCYDGIGIYNINDLIVVTNATFQTMAAGSYPAGLKVFVSDLNGGTLYFNKSDRSGWQQVSPGLTVSGAEIGYSELTSTQSTTVSNVSTGSFTPTPLTVTFTPDGVRPVIVEAAIPQMYNSVANATPSIVIYEGATVLDQVYMLPFPANTIQRIGIRRRVPAPTATVHTYELKWATPAGGTSNAYTPGGGNPAAWLRVAYA